MRSELEDCAYCCKEAEAREDQASNELTYQRTVNEDMRRELARSEYERDRWEEEHGELAVRVTEFEALADWLESNCQPERRPLELEAVAERDSHYAAIVAYVERTRDFMALMDAAMEESRKRQRNEATAMSVPDGGNVSGK